MQHTKSTLRCVKVMNLLVGKVKFHPLKSASWHLTIIVPLVVAFPTGETA